MKGLELKVNLLRWIVDNNTIYFSAVAIMYSDELIIIYLKSFVSCSKYTLSFDNFLKMNNTEILNQIFIREDMIQC